MASTQLQMPSKGKKSAENGFYNTKPTTESALTLPKRPLDHSKWPFRPKWNIFGIFAISNTENNENTENDENAENAENTENVKNEWTIITENDLQTTQNDL